MASHVTDTSMSATSQENLSEEKTVQMVVTEKEKSPGKRHQLQKDSSATTTGSNRSEPSRKTPCLARSLVKFMKITPAQLHPDVDSCYVYEDKTVPIQTQPSIEKEPARGDLDTKNEGIQIQGNAKNTSGNEERPDWTATTYDMNKDLIHKKAWFIHNVNIIPEDYRCHPGWSSLTENLAHLPFHAILVKWRISFSFPCYSPRIVFGVLSRFGTIMSMGALSQNTAFVVFKHEYHAARAIMSHQIGFSYCPLILRWWYIERYKFPLTDASDVKREDLLVSDGRLERNSKRHIAQIKREFWRKAAALSYDVSTFRP